MIRTRLYFKPKYKPALFIRDFKDIVGLPVFETCQPKQDGDTVIIQVPEESRTAIFDSLRTLPILLQRPLQSV